MINRTLAVLALAAATVLPPQAAEAASRAECVQAIDSAERTFRQDPTLLAQTESGRDDQIDQIMAEAGAALLDDDYARCLDRVEAALAIAGYG